MFGSQTAYIEHLKDVTNVTTLIYCREGQHFGVTVSGIPIGFCPVCKPFYDEMRNGPFAG